MWTPVRAVSQNALDEKRSAPHHHTLPTIWHQHPFLSPSRNGYIVGNQLLSLATQLPASGTAAPLCAHLTSFVPGDPKARGGLVGRPHSHRYWISKIIYLHLGADLTLPEVGRSRPTRPPLQSVLRPVLQSCLAYEPVSTTPTLQLGFGANPLASLGSPGVKSQPCHVPPLKMFAAHRTKLCRQPGQYFARDDAYILYAELRRRATCVSKIDIRVAVQSTTILPWFLRRSDLTSATSSRIASESSASPSAWDSLVICK